MEKSTLVERAWEIAREHYAALGVDADAALVRLGRLAISIHCWQGDDVGGFETPGAELSGGGIQATAGQGGAASSVLTVSDSLVTRNHLVGIAAGSAAVNLIRTVVSDTRAQRPGGLAGSGIAAESAKGVSSPPRVSVHRCIIAGNRTMGLAIKSGNASVTQTVIRDTRGRESDGDAGQGIYAAPDSPSDLPLEVTVQDCLLARNHYVGLSLFATGSLASAFG